MSCAKSSVGLFENVLIVNDTTHTNLIQPKTTGNDVVIAGYTSQDENVVANINSSETLFTASNILYAYVADRDITLTNAREIHTTPGQAASEIRVYKRLLNGSSVSLVTGISGATAANTTQTGVVNGTNAPLLKGEAIYISPFGDISGLEGSVITLNLRLPA